MSKIAPTLQYRYANVMVTEESNRCRAELRALLAVVREVRRHHDIEGYSHGAKLRCPTCRALARLEKVSK
jgi:hypothetical protein